MNLVEFNGEVVDYCENGYHAYDRKTCPHCGGTFCYGCCAGTNVDEGGKYDADFMICPHCRIDYYKK